MKRRARESNLFNPLYNLREAAKNLILLEDHLVHAHKRCPDCIAKHFLTIEALCDEGVALDPEHPICPILADLANVAQEGLAFFMDGGDPCYIGKALRGARKALMPKITRVAGDKETFQLWRLLDNIDTAGDFCKGDEACFRRVVEKYQGQRWDVMGEPEVDLLYDQFWGKTAAGMQRIQYHATSWDRVPSILSKGIQLPRGQQDVSTLMHDVPSISTADDPDDVRIYHPRGALLKLRVKPGSKYLKRSPRRMRKNESLLDAVNRWSREVQEKGADGFWLDSLQSTVGNQTLNPRALELVEIVNRDEAPPELGQLKLGQSSDHALTDQVVQRWIATKTDAEKEDEDAADMIKREPELKPPRDDLRKRKLDVSDPDIGNLGADGDRDLSLNYKRVAALYAAVMRLAGKVPSKEEAKEGDYWPTDKGWGVHPAGTDNVQSAPDEETAAAMAAGSDAPADEPGEGGEGPDEVETDLAIQEQEDKEKIEKEESREKAQQKKLQEIQVTKAIEQMDDTVRQTISQSGMTTEAKKDLSKALEKLSEDELGEAAKAFAANVAKFSTAEYVTEDGLTGRASMDAREALSTKPEDLKRKSPKDLGEALAKRAFAQNVVANPSMLNGRALDSEGMDIEDAEGRAKEALRFYRDSSPEIREEALTQASDQLEGMRDDDPRREELERIVDGLAMSAVIHDEDLKGARPMPGKPLAILAREMDKVGEADQLVMSPEKVYQPEGVAAVEDAMKRMVTVDPITGAVNTDTFSDFLGGEKGPYGGMLKGLKSVEKDLDSDDKETRENAQELHAFVLETLQMLKANEMTIGHGIMRSLARGETTRRQEVSQVEQTVRDKPKSIREQLEQQGKDDEEPSEETPTEQDDIEKELEEIVGPTSGEDQKAWSKCREEGKSQQDCLEREKARVADSLLNKAMTSNNMPSDMDKFLECIQGGNDPEECRDRLLSQQMESIYSTAVDAHGEPSGDDPLVRQTQEAIKSGNPSELRQKWVRKEGRSNSSPPDPRYIQSSFYIAGHIGEGISFACGLLHPEDSRRRPLTMARKLTPQVAKRITADLNKISGLYTNEFDSLGVPEDVAKDFARKCALMSKGLTRTASKLALDEDPPVKTDYPETGPTFDAEEIGEEEPGPIEDEPDEPYMKDQFTQQENRELRDKQEAGVLEEQKVDDEERPPTPGVQASLTRLSAEKAVVDSENLRTNLTAMAGKLRDASRRLGADRRSRVKAIGGELSHMAGQLDKAVTSYDKSAAESEHNLPDPFLRSALARVVKVASEVLPHVKGRVREPVRVAEVVQLASSILA